MSMMTRSTFMQTHPHLKTALGELSDVCEFFLFCGLIGDLFFGSDTVFSTCFMGCVFVLFFYRPSDSFHKISCCLGCDGFHHSLPLAITLHV